MNRGVDREPSVSPEERLKRRLEELIALLTILYLRKKAEDSRRDSYTDYASGVDGSDPTDQIRASVAALLEEGLTKEEILELVQGLPKDATEEDLHRMEVVLKHIIDELESSGGAKRRARLANLGNFALT
ncbi:MAG: hypothetical protein MUF85_00230 [Patescibacteria group bacterium]|jgi:hypothetical protein|nr:hypothetical protein [Patescibacteria group bacterium]